MRGKQCCKKYDRQLKGRERERERGEKKGDVSKRSERKGMLWATGV